MGEYRIVFFTILLFLAIEFVYLQKSLISIPYYEIRDIIFSSKSVKQFSGILLRIINIVCVVSIGIRLLHLSDMDVLLVTIIARFVCNSIIVYKYALYKIFRSASTRAYLISEIASVAFTALVTKAVIIITSHDVKSSYVILCVCLIMAAGICVAIRKILDDIDNNTERGIDKDIFEYAMYYTNKYISNNNDKFECIYGAETDRASSKYGIDRNILKYMIMIESYSRNKLNDRVAERIALALSDALKKETDISVGIAQIKISTFDKCGYRINKYNDFFDFGIQIDCAAKLINQYTKEYAQDSGNEDELRYIICRYHGAKETRCHLYVDIYHTVISDNINDNKK